MSASTDGAIQAVRFFKAPRELGAGHVGKVYHLSSGELLARTTEGGSGNQSDDSHCWPGWVSLPLPRPLRVQKGVAYLVAVDSVLVYVASSSSSSPWVRGRLAVPVGGGRKGWANRMPPASSNSSSRCFWVDGETGPGLAASCMHQ